LKRFGFLLLASLTALSPFQASGDPGRPEAHLTWRIAFGGSLHGIRTGYALAAGYRPADPGLPVPKLFELDVSDRAAVARLAGLPLFERAYAANQDEAEDPSTAAPAETPWYAKQWVWWTGAGVAILAVAGGSAAADAEKDGGGGDSGSGVLCGGNTGPIEHPDDCTIPTD
jgi:hypothetical protein